MSLSKEMAEQMFTYDPDSGVIRWKKSLSPKTREGFIAGCASKGRILISIRGKNHQAGRVAWLIHNGEIPDGLHVDHINGNPLDNRATNLRLVTASENMQNQRRAQSRSKTGLLGVSQKRGKFRAMIEKAGRKYEFGGIETAELAHEVYLLAKDILHSRPPGVESWASHVNSVRGGSL